MTNRSTNLLIHPFHANLLNSSEHLASHGTEIWLRGIEAGQNVLHQELLHAIFDIRMPHDEGREGNGHVEGTVLLRGLRIRTQDVINKTENWHESNFRSTLHQLDEEARCRNERGIEVIAVICGAVSQKYKPVVVWTSSPTC